MSAELLQKRRRERSGLKAAPAPLPEAGSPIAIVGDAISGAVAVQGEGGRSRRAQLPPARAATIHPAFGVLPGEFTQARLEPLQIGDGQPTRYAPTKYGQPRVTR
jgi:hypothetical protein